ncbi:Hypothetical predicted protein [Mytilus galloprovincialis]|uniref:C1q domain-containing protein n=2 Tax=Mytilus galloprovincialis TaxID=29158 RepID=A0A8B6GI11_MYTGA|nr:Hypothetical predicted protein [Mytilus galloprovincialis]
MNCACFILVLLFMSCFGHTTASGSCTPKLENALFEDLLSMMLKIKGTDKNNGIHQHDKNFSAFAASLTAKKILGSGETVKFDKVWTNVNNNYDPSTGVYTAPNSGVYQFSCSVMSGYKKSLRVFLWKNDRKTVAVFPGNHGHDMATLNMVLELKKGDRVYIKQGGTEKYIYTEAASNFSMFSGYLIR